MNATLVLDLLLVAIVLLFVPIGVFRGGVKEALTGGAVLLGGAGASASAISWGDDVADVIGIQRASARFLIAAASLAMATVLLGYGAGFALGRTSPSLPGRVLGGILAAGNGAMLVAFTLAAVEQHLLNRPGASTLDDGIVAGVFLRHFGWVLLAVGIAGLGGIVGGVVLDRLSPDPETVVIGAAGPPVAGAALRPVRVPRAADAGKREPLPAAEDDQRVTGSWSAAANRDQAAIRVQRQTVDPWAGERAPVADGPFHPAWASGTPDHAARAGTKGRFDGEPHDLRPNQPMERLPDRPAARVTNLWEARGWQPGTEGGTVAEHPPVMAESGVCLACGSPFDPKDAYCPECGAGR